MHGYARPTPSLRLAVFREMPTFGALSRPFVSRVLHGFART